MTSGVARNPRHRLPIGRWWPRGLAAFACLCVMFGAATARVLVWPVQSVPSTASAIVMLAGPGDRMSLALRLAAGHKAPVLVVSRGWLGYGGPCPAPTPGVRTICFDPSPGNTRGEAEYMGALAKRYGWRSVILVASRPQAARAELLAGRCFGGAIYVAAGPVDARSWPYEIAYGWGALFKAVFMDRAC